MEYFKKVNINEYVKTGVENGNLIPIKAVKKGRIIARQGILGETIITWSSDESGNEVQEKIAQVELDKTTHEPGWIVTKADDEGNIIIDNNNHPNEWIISDSKFKQKYEQDLQNKTLFKPIERIQIMVQIPENITINQWGKEINIARGGYINITDVNDMYGISIRDFNDTYRIVEEKKKCK